MSFNGNPVIVGFRQVPIEDCGRQPCTELRGKRRFSEEFALRGGQLPLGIAVKRSERMGICSRSPSWALDQKAMHLRRASLSTSICGLESRG